MLHHLPHITASHLCAYLRRPHRIYRDAFDDPTDKDPPNEFVQMLWEQGSLPKDLLEKGRIKSGMGLEGQDGDEEGSYKKGYAVQLALYTDALRQLGHAKAPARQNEWTHILGINATDY